MMRYMKLSRPNDHQCLFSRYENFHPKPQMPQLTSLSLQGWRNKESLINKSTQSIMPCNWYRLQETFTDESTRLKEVTCTCSSWSEKPSSWTFVLQGGRQRSFLMQDLSLLLANSFCPSKCQKKRKMHKRPYLHTISQEVPSPSSLMSRETNCSQDCTGEKLSPSKGACHIRAKSGFNTSSQHELKCDKVFTQISGSYSRKFVRQKIPLD